MEGETESPVQQLFRDAGVLVTGSTGFLGQLLLEKLLRSCPGIKTVFLLIRSKKEKTEAKRFAQIFDGTVSWFGIAQTNNWTNINVTVAVLRFCVVQIFGIGGLNNVRRRRRRRRRRR